MAVVLVGAVFPALVVTAAGVILVAALVGIAAGRTLDYADDGRLAKYVTAGIQYLQATDIELRGEPRNIYEIDDSQFWNLMVAARMRT